MPSINDIVSKMNSDIEEATGFKIKVRKDPKSGAYKKIRVKNCPTGQVYNKSEKRCVITSAKFKISRKKAGIKAGKTRKRFSPSKNKAIYRTKKKTDRARSNLVSKPTKIKAGIAKSKSSK